jgi:hypothetical protein
VCKAKQISTIVSLNLQYLMPSGHNGTGVTQACYKCTTLTRQTATCGMAGGCDDLQQHELVVAVLEERPCVGAGSNIRLLEMAIGPQRTPSCDSTPPTGSKLQAQDVCSLLLERQRCASTWDVERLLRPQLRPVPAQVEAVDECEAL